MECLLDVNGSYIVSQQYNLIGVKLLGIFAFKITGCDESALKKTDDEGTSTRKGINDMYIPVPKSSAEFMLKYLMDSMDD